MDPPGWTNRSNDWCDIDPVASVPAAVSSSTQHAALRSRVRASARSEAVHGTDNDDAVRTRMLGAMRTIIAHIDALQRAPAAPDAPDTSRRLADLELLAATCLRYLLLQRGDRAASTPSSRTSSSWDTIPGFGDADAAARDLDELCMVPAIAQSLSLDHAQVLDSVCRELAAVVSALGSPTAPTPAAPAAKDRAWSVRTRDQRLFSPSGSVHDEDGLRVESADDAKNMNSLAGLFDSPGSVFGSDSGILPLAPPAEPARPVVPPSCFSDLWQGAVRSTTGNARPQASSSWDQIDDDVEGRLFGSVTATQAHGRNEEHSTWDQPARTTATRNDPGDSLFPDPGTTSALAPAPLPSATGMPMAPPVTAAAAPSSRPSDPMPFAHLNTLKSDMAHLVREWTHLAGDRDAARKVVESILGADPSVRKLDKLEWAKLERHVYQYGDDHPDEARLVVRQCAKAIVQAVAKAPTFGKAAALLATRVVDKGPAGLAAAVLSVLVQVEPSLERLFGTGTTTDLPTCTGDKAQANFVAFWALLMVYQHARTSLPVSSTAAVHQWLERAVADPRGISPVAITWAVLLGGDALFRWDHERAGRLIHAARTAVQSCNLADREAVLDVSFGVIDLSDPFAALEAPPRTELYKIKRETGQSVSAQLAALPVVPWPILCRKDTWPVGDVRDVAVQPSKNTTKVQDLYEAVVDQWSERQHVAWSNRTETAARAFLKARVDTVAPSFMWLRRAITAGSELIKDILDAEDGGDDDDDPNAQVWFVGRVVAGKMARMLVSATADDPRFEYLAQLLTAMMIFNGEFRHGALTHFLDQVPQLAGVTLSMRIQPLQSAGSAKTAQSQPDTAANVRLWAHVATTVPFFAETNQYFGTPLTFLFKSFDRTAAMHDVIATALESLRVRATMDRFGEMCAFQYELAQLARNAPSMARFLMSAPTPSPAVAAPVTDVPSTTHSSGTGLGRGLGLGLTRGWSSRPTSSEWPRTAAGSSSSWSRADPAVPSTTGPNAVPLMSWSDDPAPNADPTPSSPWTPARRTDSVSTWPAPAPAMDLMSMDDTPDTTAWSSPAAAFNTAWSSPVAPQARLASVPPLHATSTSPVSHPAPPPHPIRASPAPAAFPAVARIDEKQARSRFELQFRRQLRDLLVSNPSEQDLRAFADTYSQQTAKGPAQLARRDWERVMASVAVNEVLNAVKDAQKKGKERLVLAGLALLLARRDAQVSGILKGQLLRRAPELAPPRAEMKAEVGRELKPSEALDRARYIGFYAMMARDAQEHNPFPFTDLVAWIERTVASPDPTAQSNLFLAVVLSLVGGILVDSARGTAVTGRPTVRPTVDQDRANALIRALQQRVAEMRVDPTDMTGVEGCNHLVEMCREMKIVQ